MEDYLFEIIGNINNKKQTIKYYYNEYLKKGRVTGDKMICILFEDAMKSDLLTGPVAQYMKRDINVPLSALSVMKECFDEITETKGEIPVAAEIPPYAIS